MQATNSVTAIRVLSPCSYVCVVLPTVPFCDITWGFLQFKSAQNPAYSSSVFLPSQWPAAPPHCLSLD